MKRTIYDCWRCRHHNSDNPYGIDYCEVHDTRCSFAHDDCDNFEPTDSGNERQPQPPRRLSVIVWYLEIIAVAALLGWLLMGCTTTRYVPVVSHSTDTLIQTRTQYDSIYLSDSIYISDFVRTDTVFRTVERWHTQYRDRWRHDTIYQARHDSIPAPFPVTEYVERKRSAMEWGLLIIGIAALIGGIVWIIIKIKHLLFSVKY